MRASTAAGRRAMRGGRGRQRSPGPWGSCAESWASQTGVRGAASSSWGRRGRATLAVSCGGGSRRASHSRAVAVETVVRTCSWCCCVGVAVEVEATRGRKERRPVPVHRWMCKPKTGRSRRARWWLVVEGGWAAARGEERKVRLCLLHIWWLRGSAARGCQKDPD